MGGEGEAPASAWGQNGTNCRPELGHTILIPTVCSIGNAAGTEKAAKTEPGVSTMLQRASWGLWGGSLGSLSGVSCCSSACPTPISLIFSTRLGISVWALAGSAVFQRPCALCGTGRYHSHSLPTLRSREPPA